MDWILLIEQLLNGFQLGVLLFLLAAGLTLTFGIMDFVNLAHASLYMLGAFIGASAMLATESFLLGILITVPAMMIIGAALERVVIRPLYSRHHLDHVLATFGLILFFDELVQLIWPLDGLTVPFPKALSGLVMLPFGIEYSKFRLMIIVAGLLVAVFLWFLVAKTRVGMLIRAGASNREMVSALGVNINLLFTLVFALGAALAGLAGILITPVLGAESGMGDQIIILAFVVIVIGGIGSIRGAFIAAVIVGVTDAIGRSFLDVVLLGILPPNAAEAAGPALSSMLIYIFMAVVLFIKPTGLFSPGGK
ncbi:MAG: branched-chain amino acid ABC transporter permease [Arenicellales bacterium WSBS_2016_MAG_OTU3]